jgi:bifunctional non-homologous end joining protein LigD
LRSVALSDNAPKLTNLSKIYWPDEGYTKGDLIDYYREVASFILPHLKDRPMSLNRHPNGITKPNFYQKDVSRQPPPAWVETVKIKLESERKTLQAPLCQDEAALLYLANLGCIEMNPWNSRVTALDRPDYLVIDLDPEAIPFTAVVEAAQAVRKVLEKAEADCYCKTSGKTGLHIYVPVGARYDYELVRQFGELIANLVNAELPETTSVVRRPALRQGKVYLDYLQNSRGQTLASAYSVRPHPGATVSTPLKWSEVTRKLDPSRFTIRTVLRRLDKVGDLWKPVIGNGIDLAKCVERLSL